MAVGKQEHRIKLVIPTMEHKDVVWDFKQEFAINKEKYNLSGATNLDTCNCYEEWHQFVYDNMSEKTVRQGFTPATTYLAIDIRNERLIGIIDIRHRLSALLLERLGNIGYCIRKSERQKGFGSEMLGLALEKAKELDIKKVMISCRKNNIASAKVIENNGGILESEVQDGVNILQRYWIDLSK